MTKIEYKPHCAKCGALINEEVIYCEGTAIDDPCTGNLYLKKAQIAPYSCKNCGEIFDGIEIRGPKKEW